MNRTPRPAVGRRPARTARPLRRRSAALLLAALLLAGAGAAHAQESRGARGGVVELPERLHGNGDGLSTLFWFGDQHARTGRDIFWLAGRWRLRAGDDPAWAAPAWDDAAWDPVLSRLSARDAVVGGVPLRGPEAAPVAWMRMRLKVPPGLRGEPLALWLDTRGTAEVYLDGELLHRAGTVPLDGAAPGPVPTVGSPVPVRLDGPEAVLAVRFSLAAADAVAGRHRLRDHGFWIGLEDAREAARAQTAWVRDLAAHFLFFIGVLAAFGLLHLTLWLFYRNPPGNLWYAVFAAALALHTGMIYGVTTAGSVDTWYLRERAAYATGVLACLALLRFLYSTFGAGSTRRFLVLLGAGAAVAAASWAMPERRVDLTLPLILLLLLEMLRTVASAVRKRQPGSWIVAAGIAGTVGFSSVHVAYLMNDRVPPSPYLSWYGAILLSVAMSAYLARNFAVTKKGFEALSRELEGYSRDLARMVSERTSELVEARDAAEAASRAKSQFLANMSHELRTPLNAIIGYTEIMMEEAEEQNHSAALPDLENVRTAGRSLLELIDGVLDLSKIEAGKMQVFAETFELEPLLREAVATVAPLAARRGDVVELRAGGELGAVHTDLLKLRQMLLNLLSNAVKFTQDGRVVLHAAREGSRVVLRVSDTGIGMTAAEIGRLFQPFTQADASTTRRYGGTGLGLTITRRFCEMLGGEIQVESEPGVGTVFTLSLPAEYRSAPDAARVEPAGAAAQAAP